MDVHNRWFLIFVFVLIGIGFIVALFIGPEVREERLNQARLEGKEAAVFSIPDTACPYPPYSECRSAWLQAWIQERVSMGKKTP